MRARTPAGPIDLGPIGPFVLLLRTDEPRPVYHRATSVFGGEAACGIAETGNGRRRIVLEHRHARRFARPCLRCWPKLLAGQLELKAARL